MREVGDQMHPSLRETGQGGLANTPAAREWCAAQEEEKKLLFSENFWYNKRKSAKEEVL